jgi:hypothetical protein
MANLLCSQKPDSTKLIVILTTTLVAFLISLFHPATTAADTWVKPEGSAAPDIAVWVPTGSADLPALVTADYQAAVDLPKGINLPDGAVGNPFTFGLWRGEGTTQRQFNPSLILNMKYRDEDIPLDLLPQESSLHLNIYDPTTRSWYKLCNSVDVHANAVSAALTLAIPFEDEGSSLLVLAIDTSPPLDQTVDGQGTTTLSIKRSNLQLRIPNAELEAGAHFVITLLPPLSGSNSVKLLSRAVDIKACQTSHPIPTENNRQITAFFKLLQVGFAYNSEIVSRAGGAANLSIYQLQNRDWADVEALGARMVRGDKSITVEVGNLGTFGLAVR